MCNLVSCMRVDDLKFHACVCVCVRPRLIAVGISGVTSSSEASPISCFVVQN